MSKYSTGTLSEASDNQPTHPQLRIERNPDICMCRPALVPLLSDRPRAWSDLGAGSGSWRGNGSPSGRSWCRHAVLPCLRNRCGSPGVARCLDGQSHWLAVLSLTRFVVQRAVSASCSMETAGFPPRLFTCLVPVSLRTHTPPFSAQESAVSLHLECSPSFCDFRGLDHLEDYGAVTSQRECP